MAKENAILDKEEQVNEDLAESFDFDALEEKLQSQLEEEIADMQFLAEEKEKIGSPDNLGNVIMDVVWEQFINQVAVTAGEDFIKENRGLHLDLSKDAHFLTTENFEQGVMPTHLPQPHGRVRNERPGKEGGNGVAIPHRFGGHQSGGDRQPRLSSGAAQAGRAWDFLRRPRSTAADQSGLR